MSAPSPASEVVSWFGIAAALYLFICPLVTMRTILKTKTTGGWVGVGSPVRVRLITHTARHGEARHSTARYATAMRTSFSRNIPTLLLPPPLYPHPHAHPFTTGHFSPLPYIAQLLESSIWTLYAALQLADLRAVFINNTLAVCFQVAYLAIFLAHPPAAKAQCYGRRGTAMLLALVLLATIGLSVYAWSQGFSCDKGASGTVCQHIGTVAVVINILKYCSPLSVMLRVIKTKSVAWMPLHLTLACTACSLLWGTYGILEDDVPTKIANIGGLVACTVQLVLYCVYCEKRCCCCCRRGAGDSSSTPQPVQGRTSSSKGRDDHCKEQPRDESSVHVRVLVPAKEGIGTEGELSTTTSADILNRGSSARNNSSTAITRDGTCGSTSGSTSDGPCDGTCDGTSIHRQSPAVDEGGPHSCEMVVAVVAAEGDVSTDIDAVDSTDTESGV